MLLRIPYMTTKKQRQLNNVKSKTRRLGIASMLFNGGVLVFVLHVMFSTGNLMLVLPFIVVSIMVNVVVFDKMQDLFRETEVITGKREASEETMMDGLKKELIVTKTMLLDKGFWKLVFDDIMDAVRELRNR